MLKKTLLLLLAVGAIAAVACSDDDPEPTATPSPTATADLPADGNGGNGGSGAAGGTFPAGTEAISVPDALASAGDGVVLVEGFLVITPNGARLCEALAESFPPQCGGDSVILDEPEPSALDQLTTEGDVSWTDQPVQMLGSVDGDTMSVQPLAAS